MTTITRADFAQLLGVTAPAVRQWIREGMPAQRTGNAGNAGYEIDSVAALQWLFTKRIAKAVRSERRRMEERHNLVPELDEADWHELNASLSGGIAGL